jgi:hypothetical protein
VQRPAFLELQAAEAAIALDALVQITAGIEAPFMIHGEGHLAALLDVETVEGEGMGFYLQAGRMPLKAQVD